MSKKFGIRFNGLEDPVEELIKNHSNLKTSEVYTICEIGTAGGVTLRALHEIVKEKRPDKFITCGFDIPQCALDYIKDLVVNFQGRPNVLKMTDLVQNPQLKLEEMYLFLMDKPQEFIRNYLPFMVDVVLIDGCHCYDHSRHDVLCIENKIKSGGLMFLHDIGHDEQGTDLQHGTEYINVRKMAQDLGLFDNKREGWKFIAEIPGSRVTKTGTMDGNSMLVVQKL